MEERDWVGQGRKEFSLVIVIFLIVVEVWIPCCIHLPWWSECLRFIRFKVCKLYLKNILRIGNCLTFLKSWILNSVYSLHVLINSVKTFLNLVLLIQQSDWEGGLWSQTVCNSILPLLCTNCDFRQITVPLCVSSLSSCIKWG